jgi:beta-glucanase (GH16 family)
MKIKDHYFFVLFLSFTIAISACEKGSEISYPADFEVIQDVDNLNKYFFKNTTKGDVFFHRWIFGNGDRTDRIAYSSSSITSFYPKKGKYDVELTVWTSENDLKDNKSTIKSVEVSQNVFELNFSISEVQGKVNTFLLKNESSGTFSHAKWFINDKEYQDSKDGVEVYLPFAGKYSAKLKLSVENYSDSLSQDINVLKNDASYMDHFNLVWNDEFDGQQVDTDKWVFETGQHGWGNQELQNYTEGQNSTVANGNLSIHAKLVGNGQNVGDYTSSRMNSTQSFKYGIFEIRAKLPESKGPGLWPAIWMLGESIKTGTSWPLCGEIDIMEYVSWDPDKTSCALHMQSNNHAAGNPIGSGHVDFPTAEEEFHIYGLIWTETFIKIYRDDISNVLLTYQRPKEFNKENWPFDDPHYFLLNVAVGGMYGGVKGVDDSIFPSSMEIDYVRVYKMNK